MASPTQVAKKAAKKAPAKKAAQQPVPKTLGELKTDMRMAFDDFEASATNVANAKSAHSQSLEAVTASQDRVTAAEATVATAKEAVKTAETESQTKLDAVETARQGVRDSAATLVEAIQAVAANI